MIENIIELEAKGVFFFSPCDEDVFFEWLKKISCIESFEGKGLSIILRVNKLLVGESDLRELLSLFKRYNIDMRQLKIFDEECFSSWFRAKSSFWHSGVFGE